MLTSDPDRIINAMVNRINSPSLGLTRRAVISGNQRQAAGTIGDREARQE